MSQFADYLFYFIENISYGPTKGLFYNDIVKKEKGIKALYHYATVVGYTN